MSRKRSDKQTDVHRRRIHERKASARRRGQPSSLGRATWTGIALLVISTIGVGGYVVARRFRAVPAIVRPAAATRLDPQLSALIETRVAAAEAQPTEADLRWELGLVYEANHLWHEARASYDNAMTLASGHPLWRFHAAIVRERGGDAKGALAEYRRLAAANPDFAPVHHRLGDALVQIGAYEEAAQALQRSATLRPTSPEPLIGLADISIRRRDYDAARVLLEKAVAMDSDYRLTHYLLGLAYRGLGRAEDARRELAAGVGAKKRFLWDEATAALYQSAAGYAGHLNRASDLVARGEYPAAIGLLQRAMAEQPNDTVVLNNLAAIYQRTGQHQKSLDLLRRAERIDADYFPTHINLVECLLELKRVDEAVASGQRAARLAPQIGQAQFALGRALYAASRLEAAREALRATVRLDTRNPEAFLMLGNICLRLDRPAEAKKYLTTSVKRMPESVTAHVNLGVALLRLGEYGPAARTIGVARRLAPNDPRVVAAARQLAELQRP